MGLSKWSSRVWMWIYVELLLVLVPLFVTCAFQSSLPNPTRQQYIKPNIPIVTPDRAAQEQGRRGVSRHSSNSRQPLLLFSSSSGKDREESEENDVRLLLTQCSIQSFMFLLTQMRDSHVIKWLDSFTQPTTGPFGEGEKSYNEANGLIMGSQQTKKQEEEEEEEDTDDNNDDEPIDNEDIESSSESSPQLPSWVENDKRLGSRLLYYHGINGLNTTIFPTWDAYFRSLLEQPETQYIVESNNRLVGEFTVDVDPASLCSRVLSVREQIAKEWVRDLDVVVDRGQQLRYALYQKSKRERGDYDLDPEAGGTEGIDEKYRLGTSGSSGRNWVRAPPLLSSSSPSSSSDGNDDAVFGRMNLDFLSDDEGCESGYAPSPLRKGNFDLLVLLATKESIRRILLQSDTAGGVSTYDAEENEDIEHYPPLNSAAIDFLRSFYDKRAEYYFGSTTNRYHLHDAFLEELIKEPARMRTMDAGDDDDDDNSNMPPMYIDPVIIVETVLIERNRVAKEWKEVARDSPMEHSDIRRLQLNRMMGL